MQHKDHVRRKVGLGRSIFGADSHGTDKTGITDHKLSIAHGDLEYVSTSLHVCTYLPCLPFLTTIVSD